MLRDHRRLWWCAVVAGVLLAGASPGAGRQAARRAAARPAGGAAPAEQATPFRVGETLDYRVAWMAFTKAATVELHVAERRDLFGWQTWHFQAVIHTLNPTRALFPVDDQADSYCDRATFESRQYELYLNEEGDKLTKVLHFVAAGKSPRAPGAAMVVLPGTLDPLGGLYALRSADWQRTAEFHAPVCDGHDVYEMTATREAGAESVAVDAGKFTATQLSLRISRDGKALPGIGFHIWLANDAARTPVQMEAELPFGTVWIELEKQ